MKKPYFLLLLAITATVNGQYNLESALPKTNAKIFKYSGFTVAFDTDNCTPVYSAEILTKEHIFHPVTQREKYSFKNEPTIDCVTLESFKHSGYDRGHLTPAADEKYSEQSMHDCFYTTNLCAQRHSFNAGIWEELEKAVRNWAVKYDSLIVITAPVIRSEHHEGNLNVPDKFYKVVYSLNEHEGIAFIMPQDAQGEILDYSYPIATIDTLTGLKYIANKMGRGKVNTEIWKIKNIR